MSQGAVSRLGREHVAHQGTGTSRDAEGHLQGRALYVHAREFSVAEQGSESSVGGACGGSRERQTPSLRCRPGEGTATPGRSRLRLPEEGPGVGQRRLNAAVSVSGKAINKSVGGNGGMSQRQEG